VVELLPGGQAEASQIDQYRRVYPGMGFRDEPPGCPAAGAGPEVGALEDDDGPDPSPGTGHRGGQPDDAAAHHQHVRAPIEVFWFGQSWVEPGALVVRKQIGPECVPNGHRRRL